MSDRFIFLFYITYVNAMGKKKSFDLNQLQFNRLFVISKKKTKIPKTPFLNVIKIPCTDQPISVPVHEIGFLYKNNIKFPLKQKQKQKKNIIRLPKRTNRK